MRCHLPGVPWMNVWLLLARSVPSWNASVDTDADAWGVRVWTWASARISNGTQHEAADVLLLDPVTLNGATLRHSSVLEHIPHSRHRQGWKKHVVERNRNTGSGFSRYWREGGCCRTRARGVNPRPRSPDSRCFSRTVAGTSPVTLHSPYVFIASTTRMTNASPVAPPGPACVHVYVRADRRCNRQGGREAKGGRLEKECASCSI